MKPDHPSITVITVVFNGKRFIEQTLAGVAAQDYPHKEHWLIDGGSSDGTLAIIQSHASHITRWISEPDTGIADAFNKGLVRAKGDYIMFLNADDALAGPTVLRQLLEHAQANAWPDVIYGDCELHDPDTDAFLYRAVINYDRDRFLKRETLPHPGMLMHRRYLERFGQFDTSYQVAMDYELFLRGIPMVGAVRAPFVISKVRAGGISARARTRVIDETIRALKKHGYLTPIEEIKVRAGYAARGAARRALETMGLYHCFDSMRRHRLTRNLHG